MNLQDPNITRMESHGYLIDDLAFMDTDGWVSVEDEQEEETCVECGDFEHMPGEDLCQNCTEKDRTGNTAI